MGNVLESSGPESIWENYLSWINTIYAGKET